MKDVIDEGHINYFNINRGNVLDGAIRGLNRTTFKETGRINVKFADDVGKTEGAIDCGGPTREFLDWL